MLCLSPVSFTLLEVANHSIKDFGICCLECSISCVHQVRIGAGRAKTPLLCQEGVCVFGYALSPQKITGNRNTESFRLEKIMIIESNHKPMQRIILSVCEFSQPLN